MNATFKAARVVTCADAPGDGDKVTRWTPVVKCTLTLLDQPTTGTNVAAVLALIRLESGGLPIAIGPATGDLSGSAGLTQLTDKTFMEYANPALSSNILDPLANIYAALNWALHNRRDISSVGTGLLADPQQVINPRLATCSDEPGSGDVIVRWTPVVQCALSLLKQAQTDTNVNAVLALIRKESGGDPNAANRAGTPNHFGLTQLPLDTFLEYADPVLSASQFDPLANVYAALHFTLANGSSIADIANTF